MGRYSKFAKDIVDRNLKKYGDLERAYSKSKTSPYKAIVEFDERIDEIVDRFQNDVPDEWQGMIGSLTEAKGREHELITEIEELANAGYGK